MLKERFEQWQAGSLRSDLEANGARQPGFTTLSGIPIKDLYGPWDLDGHDYTEGLGLPGEFPFTRGISPTMYRGRLWERSQYAGIGTPEDTNARLRYLLGLGAQELYLALDLPTQIGLDSDDPRAAGDVGKVGVAIDSLRDMEVIFDGIRLGTDIKALRTTAMSVGPIFLALFIALAEKQGVSTGCFKVGLQNDVLKEFVTRGTYIFPIKPSLRFSTDVIEYCARHLPHWSSVAVAGSHMRVSGATAPQEIAFTLGNAIAYVEEALSRGLVIDSFAPQFNMLMNVSTMDFFEEIAKLRATRRMWARLFKERFGAQAPESMQLKLSSFASGPCLVAQEPLNNIARIALMGLALVLSGPQSLAFASYDDALSTPSPEAMKVSQRTQQLIAQETGVTSVVDPLAGSYYLESLTDELEARARTELAKVDEIGGAVAAIENRYIETEIAKGAYRFKREIDSGERPIVGVNFAPSGDKSPIKAFRPDPAVLQKRLASLADLKRQRDETHVTRALAELTAVARRRENTVVPILDAIRAYATVGEICSALREVWGDYVKSGLNLSSVVARAGDDKTASGQVIGTARSRPIRVLLGKVGLDGHDVGIKVLALALRDEGMEVIATGIRQNPETIVTIAIQEDVDVVGLSLLSGAHDLLFPRVAEMLREQGAGDKLLIAGGVIPEEDIPSLKAAGFDAVFGPGTSLKTIADFIRNHVSIPGGAS